MFSAQVIERIAKEVSATPEQVERTIALLNGGTTIPFIARYRKDATGGLDETRLESIEQQNHYFIALEQRRRAALQNIEKLGKLTEPLRTAIEACTDKDALEDLYLPFKRKRNTRAAMAVAKGLAPLSEFIWSQSAGSLDEEAARYVDPAKGLNSPAEALQGAEDILAERISEDAAARGALRKRLLEQGQLKAHSTKASDGQKTKYTAFYDYSEPLQKVPAHRLLAILRGNREGALRIELALDDEAAKKDIAALFVGGEETPSAAMLRRIVNEAYDRLLRPAIESEAMAEARTRADESAIRVFRENVKSLLMAPPAGHLPVIGVDPTQKAGWKLAAVNAKGDFVGNATVHPDQGDEKRKDARETLISLAKLHNVQAIAVGNGSGGREALAFVREALPLFGENTPFVALVNEAGTTAHGASALACEENPDLDVALRGAVSIARRLQDPLSELVKIDPRSIGVGQYQHDVNQKRLREGLHQTVTQCVSQVGVDVNTAPASLLRYVAGIQYGTAQNIVEARRQKGGFKSREELAEIAGIGPKTFEQCAGFLRIAGGTNPLDATSVHPEAYATVGKIAAAAGVEVPALVGNAAALEKVQPEGCACETVGVITVKDILKELARPGRDPRRRFRPAKFDEKVRTIDDLSVGQELEGMVTNVTDFGAFVDVGIGQDGLVHLSELSHRYVRDPRRVVHVGESVRVKVIGVEKDPVRISFSMKALEKEPAPRRPRPQGRPEAGAQQQPRPQQDGGRPQRVHQPRPARPAAANAGERPPRRDDRRDGGRRDGANRDEQRRDRGDRHDRGSKDKKHRRPQHADAKAGKNTEPQVPLNTLLADQLAALRDSLNITR